jgi:hypothetical protein
MQDMRFFILVVYLALSLLGMFVSPNFYAMQLLDIIVSTSILD